MREKKIEKRTLLISKLHSASLIRLDPMMRLAERKLEKKRKKKGGSNGEKNGENEDKKICPVDAKKVCPVTDFDGSREPCDLRSKLDL